MPTIFTGQGSVVFATSGAGRRVAIQSVVNGTPVVVNATAHGFLYTDTVLIEGTGLTALDGKYFQLSSISTNQFTLLGTTAAGSSGSGYAIDYQLQPAIQVPAGGELADPNVMGAAIEGVANYVPFLYARTGKWRLYNQYLLSGLGTVTTPILTNPWSSVAAFSSSSFVALPNASVTLQSLSDTTGLPPVFQAGDLVEYVVSATVYGTVGAGTAFAYVNVGAVVAAGGTISSGSAVPGIGVLPNYPFGTVYLAGASLANTAPQTLTLGCAFEFGPSGAPFNNVALTMAARVDAITGASNCLLELLGPWTGYVNQYRAN